jgi:hypothetical protein
MFLHWFWRGLAFCTWRMLRHLSLDVRHRRNSYHKFWSRSITLSVSSAAILVHIGRVSRKGSLCRRSVQEALMDSGCFILNTQLLMLFKQSSLGWNHASSLDSADSLGLTLVCSIQNSTANKWTPMDQVNLVFHWRVVKDSIALLRVCSTSNVVQMLFQTHPKWTPVP